MGGETLFLGELVLGFCKLGTFPKGPKTLCSSHFGAKSWDDKPCYLECPYDRYEQLVFTIMTELDAQETGGLRKDSCRPQPGIHQNAFKP